MDYTVPVTQARAEFADLVNRAAYGTERIVVTRHGKPIAALISAADLERLRALDGPAPQVLRLRGGPATGPVLGVQEFGAAASVDPFQQHDGGREHAEDQGGGR
ncbi:type II toxin-antitoxin system Phd/YefM family antitoxin [Actinoplanes sp. NPDC051494]|uniref:type II toxin-antitoxin system Phd/YefM family antitoxin n=1 Tax=Actinoplanes sp. NPDC051494 TaxID=3363907 RepID=UPI0037A5C035